jgi:hypothetical protein
LREGSKWLIGGDAVNKRLPPGAGAKLGP